MVYELKGEPPWEIRSVIGDIRLLAIKVALSFVAIHCSANEVANWIAKHALV